MTATWIAEFATRPQTAGRRGAIPSYRADRHPTWQPSLHGRHRVSNEIAHRVHKAARRHHEHRLRARCARLTWRDHLAYWRARYLP